MAVASEPLGQLDVISARHYGENGYPHEEWTRLRRESPVHYMEPEGYLPFWAVTKHADIVELGKQPHRFLNEPRLAVFPNDTPPPPEGSTFLFVDVRKALDERGIWGFLEDCVEDGVALAPGPSCGADYEGWVRLCYTAAPPDAVSDAVGRLALRLGA